jgi:membrane protein implicated in regulation of membrane protease activity
MNWDHSTAWWMATGVLVALELATGTFYLLMVAIGTAAGALAAHAGLPFTGQLLVASVIGGAGVAAWHRRRQQQPAGPRAAENPDLNLDVGSRVQVPAWGPERQARVTHRGAAWNARYVGSGDPMPGEHVIVAVEGTQLALDRAVR